ncbi:MAG: radical SAM protein [Nitrococcus mobilis]|nr:radical SAM protein [Nitrococcus mobilis]
MSDTRVPRQPPQARMVPSTALGGRLRSLRQILLEGGPGFCQFGINNACNAGCEFCSFNIDALPKAAWRFVPLAAARHAIDILVRHGMRYLVITGGEPMLHPDLYAIMAHARAQGMVIILVTNGSRLNAQSIQALTDNGLSSIIISIDAASAEAHEANRKLTRVCARIQQANQVLRRFKIQSTASVTMSRLIDDYQALPAFLESLGFSSVTFSYPLTTLGSSFLGYADSGLVTYSTDELFAAFEQVKRLKSRMHVLNPTASIKDMQRFLRKQPQRFSCLGGYKYFYLDWQLMLWRCHYWEKPLCSIFEFDDSYRVRDGCTRCMIDCYRDASVMQHVAVAVSDSIDEARHGRLRQAARRLFNRDSLDSIRAVAQSVRWIRHI